MNNEIEKVREATALSLRSAKPHSGESIIEVSPCGRYTLKIEEFTAGAGMDIAVATVRRTQDGHAIATVNRNDSRCFYGWVSQAAKDYLLFPEDIEGQTVVDLTTGQVSGFSSQDDGFIWTEYHLSPDQMKLAVVGCYWACPYSVTVYDFQNPLELPLPKIAVLDLPKNDSQFVEWIGNSAYSVRTSDGEVRVFDLRTAAADARPSG